MESELPGEPTMTVEEVDAAEARAVAASPGPWFEKMAPDGEMMPDGSGGVDGYIETGAICSPPPDPTAEDAAPEIVADDVCHPGNRAFIRAARTDVPRLCATVRAERLRAEANRDAQLAQRDETERLIGENERLRGERDAAKVSAEKTATEVKSLRLLVDRAAGYVENAADIIAGGIDHDEDDDADAREFTKELRVAALGAGS